MKTDSEHNAFLTGSLPAVFARTAAPTILITTINGFFAVVDAYFLGAYVGPEALSAVTLIFPGLMLIIALQSLVSNGMASILAPLPTYSRSPSSLWSMQSTGARVATSLMPPLPAMRRSAQTPDSSWASW